jgi:tetratricopeptide (TPR) repeat protein
MTSMTRQLLKTLLIISVFTFTTSALAHWKLKKDVDKGDKGQTVATAAAGNDARARGDDAYAKKRYAEAMKWYLKAANQGDAEAENSIGFIYDNGLGVKQDYTAALSWYRKAADHGLAKAQYNVGTDYDSGLGVPRDSKQARSWMEKAAAAGDQDATNWLANESAPTIAFDRNKVSRDAVIAAVSAVFLAHGYKSSAHQESVHRVQEGQPAKQLDWRGPIRFIDTELQPPLGGSDSQEGWHSKPWRYKALINDDNVELRVYVKADPVQFMGVVLDESQVPLRPPDMKVIVQELQTKLQ